MTALDNRDILTLHHSNGESLKIPFSRARELGLVAYKTIHGLTFVQSTEILLNLNEESEDELVTKLKLESIDEV